MSTLIVEIGLYIKSYADLKSFYKLNTCYGLMMTITGILATKDNGYQPSGILSSLVLSCL